jgi:integrase
VILNTAVQWQVLESNPAARIKPPKVPRHIAHSFDDIQTRELIQMLEDEPLKYKTAIILLIYSGLRLGELNGLMWSDIDFDNGTLSVGRSSAYLPGSGVYIKETKNESSTRVIKLPEQMFVLLSEYKAWQDNERATLGDAWVDEGYIFTRDIGGKIHPNTIPHWYRLFRIKHDIYIKGTGVHSLRHTNASLQIAGGVNVQTVAHRLGHTTAQTTLNIYAHAIKSADAAAAETIADILDPVKIKVVKQVKQA